MRPPREEAGRDDAGWAVAGWEVGADTNSVPVRVKIHGFLACCFDIYRVSYNNQGGVNSDEWP